MLKAVLIPSTYTQNDVYIIETNKQRFWYLSSKFDDGVEMW